MINLNRKSQINRLPIKPLPLKRQPRSDRVQYWYFLGEYSYNGRSFRRLDWIRSDDPIFADCKRLGWICCLSQLDGVNKSIALSRKEKARGKERYYANHEAELARSRKYRENNPEKRRQTNRRYLQENKAERNEYQKEYKKKRYSEDEEYRQKINDYNKEQYQKHIEKRKKYWDKVYKKRKERRRLIKLYGLKRGYRINGR